MKEKDLVDSVLKGGYLRWELIMYHVQFVMR